jgi:2-keto-4-pentenoate hydratase/2-oxohepta-3-ene-1,7-dioic acid hydratase in catechol pathway
MKLLRHGPHGQEKPGVLHANGSIRDLPAVVSDISGPALSPESIRRLRQIYLSALPLIPNRVRIGPGLGPVGKFICIGLNYSDHAAGAGMKVLVVEPVVFMKATWSIIVPDDNVVIPPGALKTDWEVELGVVIGAAAKYVDETDAMAHVAGYCIVNDPSERAFQLEGTGQWVKGKSADTFGPIGPWPVMANEIADPQNLDMWLTFV